MTNVYDGKPDARQGDANTVVSRFRPRYRALTEEEKALHDAIKAKADEMEQLFQKVKTGRYNSLAITSLEQSVMWIVKELTSCLLICFVFITLVLTAAPLSAQPAPTLPPSLRPAPAPQPAPSPAGQTAPSSPTTPLSADFQAGFCTGWNSAGQVEQQRHGNWRALIQLGQPAPDGPVGITVNSVQMYVLLQPLPPGAALNLTDGRTVVCPAASEEKK